MSRPYREIGKSFADRTVELIHALQLIADSLTQIRQGQVRHFITLSGQLRSLIAEKGSKTDSLLLYIAEVLQQDLRLYAMPDVHDPLLTDELRRDRLFQLSGFPITTERQFAAQVEMTLPEILDLEIITFRGNNYTARKVIEWYANKAGGAHYSRTLPEDFAELRALYAMKEQPLDLVLIQIGEATLATGLRLLKSVVDLDLHALVVVPDQDSGHISDVNFVLDSQYEDTAMRISLVLNKRLMPSLFVSGLQGVAARVDCDRLVEWSEPRYIHAAVRIDDDLSTLLELWVDGTLVGRLRVPEPLFVLSDPLDYENYYNRAVDGEPQLFSFAAGIIGMYSRELGPIERANFLLYMEDKRQNPGLPLRLYTSKSFEIAARGTKVPTEVGTVRNVSVGDLLRKMPHGSDDDLPKK